MFNNKNILFLLEIVIKNIDYIEHTKIPRNNFFYIFNFFYRINLYYI